jgi:hypothetical protein
MFYRHSYLSAIPYQVPQRDEFYKNSHLLVLYVPTYEVITTESRNCFIRTGKNAIPKHACPEAKSNNPTTRLTLLWAPKAFMGNSNYSQVSQEVAGQVIPKRRHGKTVLVLILKKE